MNIFTVTKSVQAELAESSLFAEAPPDFARDLSSAKVRRNPQSYNPTQMAFRIPNSRYGSSLMRLRLVAVEITARRQWAVISLFIPNVGMFCSQPGNISFPRWECIATLWPWSENKCSAPLLNNQLLLKNKGTLLNHKCHLLRKVHHLSHHPLKSPLAKGFCWFYLSRHPSRHLSHLLSRL